MDANEYQDAMIAHRQRLADAKEKVTKTCLLLASTHYAQEPSDPGWDADMYEDMFDEAITEYAVALAELRAFERGADNATQV